MSDPIKKYCPFHTDRRRALAEGDYCAECLVEELHRNGFRECDIAACNCGGWHNPTIAKLTEENKALRAELEKTKEKLKAASQHADENLNALTLAQSQLESARAAKEWIENWQKDLTPENFIHGSLTMFQELRALLSTLTKGEKK